MDEILDYKWEKYVGRRQPSLRGDLVFRGVLKWFKNNNFKKDMSNLYIFFSTLTKDRGIISDHYINTELKDFIVDKIKAKLLKNLSYADSILLDLKEKKKNLKEFSLRLSNIENFENKDFTAIFNEFCNKWEDFGPNLYVLLLVIEACENVILDAYQQIPDAKTKLMKIVSSKVQSEFFNTKKKAIKNYSYFPKKYNLYIELLAKLMEYRDKRKMVYDDSWYKYANKFFKHLEKISNLGEKVHFLGRHQIGKILEGGKIDIELPSLVYANNNEIKTIYGERVRKLEGEILRSTIESFDEIKGNVANIGKAKGKVRLIEPYIGKQEFQEGEILVTRMTTPDLMPYIRKASAIVTDEGGITSHAAIVSRELHIPCIIGTKVATQVFNNGDKVEVDTHSGIIKRLK